MTRAGKGIILAALDILIETRTLIKQDFDEAKKIVEQIPENDLSLEKNTGKTLIKPGRLENAK
jgi:hypothetical protein